MVISTDLHIFHGYTTNQLLTIVCGSPMVIITDSSSKVFVLHQQRHTHTRSIIHPKTMENQADQHFENA
jgi:hypothetical protein